MNEQTSNDKWCSKREVALHFGIGIRTVTDWMGRKLLPYVKVGHVVRFHLPDCELAVKKYQVNTKH